MKRTATSATTPSRPYRAIADFYDAEYESNDVLDNDVPFLLTHLPKRPQRVLELCCGTGRAALPLVQAGHHVTGVDYDADLLAIATRKREAIAAVGERLTLVNGDVLAGLPDGPFNWAVILFNTFLAFTTRAEQQTLFANVYRSLTTGGRFWIDIYYPDLELLGQEHHEGIESATFFAPSRGRSVHRVTDIVRSRDRPQVQEITFRYTWAEDDGRLRDKAIKFDLTWMFPRELVGLLEGAGFVIEKLYGDYDGSDVSPDSSRIIVLAKKR